MLGTVLTRGSRDGAGAASASAGDEGLATQALVPPEASQQHNSNGESTAEEAPKPQTAEKPASVDIGSVITQVRAVLRTRSRGICAPGSAAQSGVAAVPGVQFHAQFNGMHCPPATDACRPKAAVAARDQNGGCTLVHRARSSSSARSDVEAPCSCPRLYCFPCRSRHGMPHTGRLRLFG